MDDEAAFAVLVEHAALSAAAYIKVRQIEVSHSRVSLTYVMMSMSDHAAVWGAFAKAM